MIASSRNISRSSRNATSTMYSGKSMDPRLVMDVYTEISKRFDYPLHLGVAMRDRRKPEPSGPWSRRARFWPAVSETPFGSPMRTIPCTRSRMPWRCSTARTSRTQGRGAHRLPYLRSHSGRSVRSPGRPHQDLRSDQGTHEGGRDGLHRQWPWRSRRRVWPSSLVTRGIIYVQGERVANVPEEEILDRLLEDVAARIASSPVKPSSGKRRWNHSPDPIGELGGGVDKIAAGQVEQLRSTSLSVLDRNGSSATFRTYHPGESRPCVRTLPHEPSRS